MRLFLLPISTRRTLIYCQRLNVATTQQQGWIDKGTARAAKLWAGWEKKESGWQRKVVDYGNEALKHIPYEEWGLKSIPPLSARREAEEITGKEKVEVCFPQTLLSDSDATNVLKKLATERQPFHKRRMLWCIVGMPITAPVALVPIIPNIPFFYLVFRTWSHWRALAGSKHIEFLVDKKLTTPKPSRILDEIYSTARIRRDGSPVSMEQAAPGSLKAEPDEQMVLFDSDAKKIADELEVPELEVEVNRAIWQVEKVLKVKSEAKTDGEKLGQDIEQIQKELDKEAEELHKEVHKVSQVLQQVEDELKGAFKTDRGVKKDLKEKL